jgi:hypothetical protein
MRETLRVASMLAVLAVLGAATTFSCSSASSGGTNNGTGATGAAGGGGTGGFGGASGSGGSDASAGTGGIKIDASLPDGSSNPDASCGDITEEATKVPLAMYIMLDQSGSMSSGGKWTAAVDGIKQFVQDPGSAGIKVGLQMFPTLADDGQCNGAGYSTPAVPMGVLPGNATAIINALPSDSNGFDTPTEGALNGLINYCKVYSGLYPKEKVIALFITDGEPNGCNEAPTSLASILQNGFTQAPSVLTFSMGMDGADFTLLSQLAVAGGTGVAFDLSSGGAQALLGALQSIAGSVIGCDYTIPDSDAGKIDYSKVVVRYTSGDAGTGVELQKVSDQSACGTSGGFYYDNPATPTKITLCPASCDQVQADSEAKVEVLLGCAVVIPS